jgi:hypothetical protein
MQRTQDNITNQKEPSQAELEEYNSLRQELLFHQENSIKSRNQSLLVISALIGYGIANKTPMLFIIAWLLNLEYWRLYNSHRNSMAKIGCYIATFFNYQGLKWEERIAKVEGISTNNDKISFKNKLKNLIQAQFYPHPVVSLSCMFLLIYFWIKPMIKGESLVFGCLFLFAIGFNIFLTNLRLAPEWNFLRSKWFKVWQDILNKTKPKDKN